jgi:hypothetical protein
MIQELQKKLTINYIAILSGIDYQNISQIPFPAMTLNYPAKIDYEKYDKNKLEKEGLDIAREAQKF